MDVEGALAGAARPLVGWALGNRRTRSFLYGLRNSVGFADAYEHEKMLSDRRRCDAYARGIGQHIHPGQGVLDLGTGTGVLAMLAARRGAQVHAIDHSRFIDVAARSARRNALDGITFEQIHSRSFQPSRSFDVVLHEQMGDDLFDEHMLDNLIDLRDRVLGPGGRILPARFELFLEAVTLRPEYRVASLADLEVHGLRFDVDGSASRPPDGARSWFLPRGSISQLLTEPEPVLRLDIHELPDVEAVPTTLRSHRTVTRPGQLDGFVLYFRCIFDDDNAFDTSPLHGPCSWGNRFFRVRPQPFVAGDGIEAAWRLHELADATTWRVDVSRHRG
jgi:type I protein arginine methyltransferase